jgi:quercetin dioxygenase-like cupin family protein
MPKGAKHMISFSTTTIDLADFWHEEAPDSRGRGGFPLVAVPETDSLGVVYFEIEPGNNLGMHTDSQDELIVVLEGNVHAVIGEESGDLSAGDVAFIPAMAPHGFTNTGNTTLRCLGVFPDSNVVSTFGYTLQPFGTAVLSFKALVPAGV